MLPPFQQLVDAYADDVARLCAAMAGQQDGRDCAQSAWLAALRAYPGLRSATNLRGWLLTIAAHTAVDHHRARSRRPIPLAELPERPAPTTPVHDDELWSLVRDLPERQRTAVALHYVLDLPHTEVAAALGCSAAMSRRLVSDALATLRTQWRNE